MRTRDTHPLEVRIDVRTRLGSTVEARPVHAQQTHEFVAGIDGDQVHLVVFAVAAHDQRFDVVLQLGRDGFSYDVVPRVQVE